MRISIDINPRRILPAALISSLLMFTAYFYLSPYLAILDLKLAFEKKDYNKSKNYINFPSVRQSLKEQINNSISNSLDRKLNYSSYTSLGLFLIDPIVNGIVDATITPNGLSLLLSRGELSNKNSNSINSNRTKNKVSKRISGKKSNNQIELYYQTPNLFILSSQVDTANRPIKAFWKRQGLFGWRINSILIPPSLLKLNI